MSNREYTQVYICRSTLKEYYYRRTDGFGGILWDSETNTKIPISQFKLKKGYKHSKEKSKPKRFDPTTNKKFFTRQESSVTSNVDVGESSTCFPTRNSRPEPEPRVNSSGSLIPQTFASPL